MNLIAVCFCLFLQLLQNPFGFFENYLTFKVQPTV